MPLVIPFGQTYGGALDDFGFSIMQTADNGYIITGATNSFGAGSFDCLLMKTDSNELANGQEPMEVLTGRMAIR